VVTSFPRFGGGKFTTGASDTAGEQKQQYPISYTLKGTWQ
jgi:hypothetical protein